ncbi:ComEC/Rec2 family competence protein [Microbacterium oleivorans]|uniref:MBL fold metallo-hydrolase n=1 Tax=Microbacterium oleivorans TaxID=273677 RepID=A0A4R5YK29_9MICO|nr:MBL fold metallo-hydrolase [Microbacterium oleivorans]TDL45288.1 MBL fold metallo-hydrolase [Microbacterium oleivorans]
MIEIEFIPIGDKTNTGDAILVHFTEPGNSTERVVLIDGGFTETAERVVAHINAYYRVPHIDLVVCTHPDSDHINGLFGIFERIPVRELLIHRPSEHGYTSGAVEAAKVDELISLAQSKGATVTTGAFAGSSYFGDALRVAGPTADYYREQLALQAGTVFLAHKAGNVFASALEKIRNALSPRSTDPGEGELTDHGGTTPRNNSSIILDVQVDGYRAFLTGDAGAPALEGAADYLTAARRDGKLPDFFDVPHHGSRHNLTTSVMDRLAGPIVGDIDARTAFVSVGKEADDFPRAEVANAFRRRGYRVTATRGQTIRWYRGGQPRPGWRATTPLPWLSVDD